MAQGDSRDLRLIGRSEDGVYLELEDQEGNSFALRISDNLKSVINAPRLTSVSPIDDRPSYTVKDIQNRLRSGESMDAIARTTDWPLEKIEKFAGPILQERAYVIDTALKTSITKDKKSQTLGEITNRQLAEHGANLEEVEWNTYRNIDGSWNLVVHYPTRSGVSQANWNFDLANRVIDPVDDAASWLIGEGKSERPKVPSHGFISPTDPPRLVAVKEEVHLREVIIEEEENIESDSFEFEDGISAKSDGVTARPKLPSWDDIMFGSNKPTEE